MGLAEFLTEHQVEFEPLPHALAFSAQKRAKYLGVPGAQVAKCVLLSGPEGLFLAVLPATHQIDANALVRYFGGVVRLADEREMAATFRDCEWGVVPPFGRLYGLPTLLDESLTTDSLLVFEGQTHVEAIRLRCADFERLEGPRRLAFAYKTST
jgi:Ala-tRNA(Pro) deacylase